MRRDDSGVLDTAALASANTPWDARWSAQGIVELLEPLVNEGRKERIRTVVSARIGNVTLLLDGPHDPHNGAAVMRSCEAFGLSQLHVLPTEPFLVSHRVAQGTQRWIGVVVHESAVSAKTTLSSRGYALVATHPAGELVPADLAEFERLAIVLGNEHHGIGPELSEAALRTVRIPMRGFVESLNLSVSAAILLEAATRGRPGDLSPEAQLEAYARGLYHSVARANDVLGASIPR
jgi:tRNA (guanosine-2'-O-)-methyltransferase